LNAISIFIAIRIAGNIAGKYCAATVLGNVLIFCFLHSKTQPELAPNSLQKKGLRRGKIMIVAERKLTGRYHNFDASFIVINYKLSCPSGQFV